jgi:hypothetical protein
VDLEYVVSEEESDGDFLKVSFKPFLAPSHIESHRPTISLDLLRQPLGPRRGLPSSLSPRLKLPGGLPGREANLTDAFLQARLRIDHGLKEELLPSEYPLSAPPSVYRTSAGICSLSMSSSRRSCAVETTMESSNEVRGDGSSTTAAATDASTVERRGGRAESTGRNPEDMLRTLPRAGETFGMGQWSRLL